MTENPNASNADLVRVFVDSQDLLYANVRGNRVQLDPPRFTWKDVQTIIRLCGADVSAGPLEPLGLDPAQFPADNGIQEPNRAFPPWRGVDTAQTRVDHRTPPGAISMVRVLK
jgi:hypothetical protein